MKRASRIRPRWIVWTVVILHLLWAGLLLVSDAPTNITALHTMSDLTGSRYLVMLILAGAGLSAAYGAQLKHMMITWLLLQQMILGASAYGAMQAIWESHFADGVERSRAFLAADQAPIMLLAFVYTLAIIEAHRAWRSH